MGGCGGWCVIFIWVSFLWPILVTAGYLYFKKSITRKGKYFFINIIVGYVVYGLTNVLIMYFARHYITIEELRNSGINMESAENIFVLIAILILFLPPIVSSHFVAKKFS